MGVSKEVKLLCAEIALEFGLKLLLPKGVVQMYTDGFLRVLFRRDFQC
jgi:hypothetical protein